MNKLRLCLPLLTSLALTFSLYAANADRLGWAEIVSPLLISLFVALFFIGIFSLHPRTLKSMPLIASVFTATVLLWYLITPYAGITLIVLTLLVVVWRKKNTKYAEQVIAVGMVTALLFSAGWGIAIGIGKAAPAPVETMVADKGDRPNIYFLVFDRMPSPEAMLESGLDPTAFVKALRDRGFYVPADAMSRDEYIAFPGNTEVNTTRTMRFFASVLNMGVEIPLNIPYKECRQMITYPSIKEALHEAGYTFHNVASWFAETAKIDADYTYHYEGITLLEKAFSGELVEAFWARSIFSGFNLRILQPEGTMNKIERDRHVWQMIKIKELMPVKSRFIMAHFMLPHEPFAWAADGTPEENKTLSTMELYTEQIKFAADFIVQLADNLRKADPTATIIIQSDEGMAFKKPAELNYTLSPVQWNGVFIAWYLPYTTSSELTGIKHTQILDIVFRLLTR